MGMWARQIWFWHFGLTSCGGDLAAESPMHVPGAGAPAGLAPTSCPTWPSRAPPLWLQDCSLWPPMSRPEVGPGLCVLVAFPECPC